MHSQISTFLGFNFGQSNPHLNRILYIYIYRVMDNHSMDGRVEMEQRVRESHAWQMRSSIQLGIYVSFKLGCCAAGVVTGRQLSLITTPSNPLTIHPRETHIYINHYYYWKPAISHQIISTAGSRTLKLRKQYLHIKEIRLSLR